MSGNTSAIKIFGLLVIFFIFWAPYKSTAQTYVFATLQGAPVNTTNWNLAGSAQVANIKYNNLSEILLCPDQNYLSGAIFYNKAIDLTVCNEWIAEFDFRIYDGTSADGLAFCFLDVPPTGYVYGGGLGIPGTANGLKVCFDTYQNCGPVTPKIEIRWGEGYSECWPQPTLDDSTGVLNFIRSDTYNHAKIVYNNGNINVYVNNTLYLTGYQQFNFSGYMGFTASTGGATDNHSITNVAIYTNMPPSNAGAAKTICSGSSTGIGVSPNSTYAYNWSPSTGLNSTSVANPTVTLTNSADTVLKQKYYVQTAFSDNSGCTTIDSVIVSVNPTPKVSIAASSVQVCAGATVKFTATTATSPVTYLWFRNNLSTGIGTSTYSDTNFNDGDSVTCVVTSPTCNATSNSIKLTVNPLLLPAVAITASANGVCVSTPVTFTATPTNGGDNPVYQWLVNNVNTGSTGATFTTNTLSNNDVVSCMVTSNAVCATPAGVASNNIVMTLTPLLPTKINIIASANNVCKGTPITFTASTTNEGSSPDYQWLVNGLGAGTNSPTFTSDTLSNGDLVTCLLTGDDPCAVPGSIKSDTVSLVIYPLPAITMGGNKTINKGGQTTLNATAAGDIASLTWSPSTGLSSNNILNPIATPDTTTTYTLTVQTNAGCVLSASLQVIVLTPITVPTGFTPNGDGVNDVWNIKNLQYYQNSSVQIFDRYGQAVYQSKGYSKPWDGTINGRRLPMGTYYYVILLNNNTPPISGYVTIIR